MAVAIPIPQTIATWNTPTCAPVETAAQTLPQPKKTRRKVPKNSPMAHFGTGVAAISTSALTCGGGSGRVALIGSFVSIESGQCWKCRGNPSAVCAPGKRFVRARAVLSSGAMFLPNQKVVCVDGKFPLGIEQLYSELPKEGSTYTIRDIVPGVGLTGEEGETAVYLCEITGPLNAHGIERGFRADRFAPLQTIEEEAEEELSLGLPQLVPA